MYSKANIQGIKKIFLIMLILVFTTGCSPLKSLFGPGDDSGDSSFVNDQLEEEFGGEDISDILDDFEKQVKEGLEELDNGADDQGIQDAIDDFESKLEHDVNMLDDKREDNDFRDELLDFEEQLENDFNDLDNAIDDLDMRDAIDDFETKLEHDVDMLDERVDDYFMDKAIKDFKKQAEEDLMDGQPGEDRPSRSCDAIAETSTCIDYIGSFWTETQMKYACEYSGTLSPESCETGSIGGCNVGKGSFNDMIIWMYPHGGSPIAADTVKSARPACDTNPMGTWVNAR